MAKQPWEGDLLGRRDEAAQFVKFIESVAARSLAGKSSYASYVIAVDGPYGQGKTYFLKELARDLAEQHPVAFIDAWADEVFDDPFIALASNLKSALAEHLTSQVAQKRWTDFKEKAGKVAKLTTYGLFKRGATVFLTGGVVDQVEDVFSSELKDLKSGASDAAKDFSKSSFKDIEEGLSSVSHSHLLEQGMKAFDERKSAVESMKNSLRGIIDVLPGTSSSPPIVIIIDELDRCKPLYAVRMLEEVKHLFDVEGVIFIFGMHGEQLRHSVSALYGTSFDSQSYLRRFFHRRFRLAEADLRPLVESLIKQSGVELSKLQSVRVTNEARTITEVSSPELIARYMKMFGLGARDAFEVVDRLTICASLVELPVVLRLILPMICNDIKGKDYFNVEGMGADDHLRIAFHDKDGRLKEKDAVADFRSFAEAIQSGIDAVIRAAQQEFLSEGARLMIFERSSSPNQFDRLQNYPALLQTVSKFRYGQDTE
ncbi:MAG TPA: P-loop NTPase fold protein [Allosphingosinicella sp.]|nr:P-loop NTPase fold protein [Allosphingosinicella sp.]